MGKLTFKQKVFKMTDHYDVFDENQVAKYHVDQDFKLFGNTIHVSDENQTEVIYIEKKMFKFLPEYHLTVDGSLEVVVKSRWSFLGDKIDITCDEYQLFVKGDFMDYIYQIYDSETMIADINRKLFTFGDTFEIDVLNPKYEKIILALAIIVDDMVDSRQRNKK